MSSPAHALIIAILASTLVACEVPRVATPHHVIGSTTNGKEKDVCVGSETASDLCKQALKNVKELARYKENEWTYNRGRDDTPKDKRPFVCVAISGGGIRSAAFGIGVMQGLNEKGVTKNKVERTKNKSLLKYVDILSGTSGGAYAVSWYYMQYPTSKNRDTSDNQLFASGEHFQRQLRANAHFLGMHAYVGSAFSDTVLLSPFNFLVNGLWGTHTNTSLGHYIYRWNIKKTFHGGESATLVNLRDKVIKNELPYFIITTTSRIDENKFHTDGLLRNTVFEFTPFHMGNDGFTYIRSDDERAPLTDLAEIVAISGAAPDSSQAVSGGAQRFLASGLNSDYGRYIKNYNDTRHELRRTLTQLAPFPLYLFTEAYNRDLRGSDIYLSDGGHQENLAAYPLIRRQCEHLIIVDGGYDPNYEFEDYFKLKYDIERELRVTLTLQKTDLCKKSPKRENCRETNIDGIEDRFRRNLEQPGTRGEAEGRRQGLASYFFSGRFPIVNGTIRYFPILGTEYKAKEAEGKKCSDKECTVQESQDKTVNNVEWQEINITYIKLAIDEDLFKGWATMSDKQRTDVKDQVGNDAAEYFVKVTTDTCNVRYFYPCAFPQFSTAYQSFTDTQFKAYVDLGATMVKQHLDADITNGSLTLTAK